MTFGGSTNYLFEVYLIEYGSDIDKSGTRFVETSKIKSKFQVTLNSEHLFREATDGDWSTSSPELKESSGHWRFVKDDDGYGYTIWILDHDDTGFFSAWFGTRAELLLTFDGLFKFPPFIGETGTGLLTGQGYHGPVSSIGWRLLHKT